MKVKFVCTNCGSTFEDYLSQRKGEPFCSKACAYKGREVNLVGEKFGRLLCLERIRENGETRYLCRCDCGARVEVAHANLRSGGSESCGCKQKELLVKRNKKTPEQVIKTSIWHYYKRNARVRALEWGLSYERFVALIDLPCYYCGRIGVTETIQREHAYCHNGVDRLDNHQGYTAENSVPCCKTCNLGKNSLLLDEFREWAKAIAQHVGEW